MDMDRKQGKHDSMTGTMTSSIYDDDEPVTHQPANAAGNGVLILTTHYEYPAVPTGEKAEHDDFVVMVHVGAPALPSAEPRRAPLDLVAVLDVSESMEGAKLAQVKRAMGFVVDNLGPHDRLSVVAFSGDGQRVTRLARMTEDGKTAAKRAVESLVVKAGGSTNLRAGLDEAAKVLGGSRHENDVAGVILVSDVHDSCGTHGHMTTDHTTSVPKYFLKNTGWRPVPVHTLGLGSDLDAAALNSISDVTGGTFSFIEDHAVVQDALAQCIGGLRSVTAQGVWIEVDSIWADRRGVRVTEVKSGRHDSSISEVAHATYEATVSVDELYADEERRFLLLLEFPGPDPDGNCLSIKVRCNYLDIATGQVLNIERGVEFVNVLKPGKATDVARCKEVERELLRMAAVEDMTLAREAAERGAYTEAARILDASRESLSRSAPALSGDAMCKALVAELHELRLRVSDEREYRKTGRACLLAGMSSHGLQRGSSVRLSRPLAGAEFGCVGSSVFATPAMRKMEKMSVMLRKHQEAVAALPPLPDNGSNAVRRPRSRLGARLASAVPRLGMLSRYRRLLLRR